MKQSKIGDQMHRHRKVIVSAFLSLVPLAALAAAPPEKAPPVQESATGIQHSFLALGGETYLLTDDNQITWKYPANTRDGFVLPDGHFLLAVSKNKELPGGGAVELTRDGKVVWQFKGTQSEVNTVQKVDPDRYMLTEAGNKPRILEVDREGKIVVEVPIQAQTANHHLQTRMSRKLANGNYLVPQLLDKVVREYAPDGKIVWEAHTPDDPKECWPFTAIRLENGNTLTTCTHGKTVVEFDKDGKIVWQLSNSDLPEPLLIDPCGAQRLPNGNTVITSYGSNKPGAVKMLEVTPDKKLVWTYRDSKSHGIHEFQILDTNGVALSETPMK
jgi:hypothetical protein